MRSAKVQYRNCTGATSPYRRSKICATGAVHIDGTRRIRERAPARDSTARRTVKRHGRRTSASARINALRSTLLTRPLRDSRRQALEIRPQISFARREHRDAPIVAQVALPEYSLAGDQSAGTHPRPTAIASRHQPYRNAVRHSDSRGGASTRNNALARALALVVIVATQPSQSLAKRGQLNSSNAPRSDSSGATTASTSDTEIMSELCLRRETLTVNRLVALVPTGSVTPANMFAKVVNAHRKRRVKPSIPLGRARHCEARPRRDEQNQRAAIPGKPGAPVRARQLPGYPRGPTVLAQSQPRRRGRTTLRQLHARARRRPGAPTRSQQHRTRCHASRASRTRGRTLRAGSCGRRRSHIRGVESRALRQRAARDKQATARKRRRRPTKAARATGAVPAPRPGCCRHRLRRREYRALRARRSGHP